MIKDNITEKIISELRTCLKNKYADFLGLYCIGSRARGDFRTDSDLDIVLIFGRKPDWKFKNEIWDIIFDFILEYDLIIDCKVLSSDELNNPTSFFRQNIQAEGLFYAV